MSVSEMQVSLWRLFRFADRLDYSLMIIGALAAVAHGLVLPTNMYYFGRIVNALAANQGDTHAAGAAVLKLAKIMFIVAANSGWVTWLEVWCWLYTGERQSSRIRVKYLEQLLHQEIEFFDTRANTGEIVGHISNDILLVQDAMGEKVGGYIHNVSTFVGGVVVALFNGWQIALLAIATVPLLAGTGAVYTKLYTAAFVKSQASHAQATSIAQQAISNIRTVYSFVQESQALKSFSMALQAAKDLGEKSGMIKGLGLGLTLGIINCSWALELWCANILVSRGDIDGGKVLTAVFCIVFGGMALGQTTPELQVFSKGRVAAYRIFEVIDRAPKIDSRAVGGETLDTLQGSIEFDNVCFHYPARPDVPIFKNLSLHVPAGSSLALVGESGSGKSTAISLIQRFYDPILGELKVDGKNLKSLQLKWWRTKIGLVGQEPVLFGTTIRENIRFGKPDATAEEVEAAAKASNAYDFIINLPHGFETQLGQGVSQVSGGEKQRIAIARAIIKNPTILLLDEATSALDVKSERMVQNAVDNVMVGRTTLTVAHRLSTIQACHNIAVFHNGSILQLGNHAELLRQHGPYANLARLQIQPEENIELEKKHDPSVIQELPPTKSSPVNHQQSAPTIISQDGSRPWSRTICSVPGESWYQMTLGSAASLITGCINPLFALFLIDVVQLYYEPGSKQKVNRWCAIIAGLGGIAICTNILQHYLFAKTGENISKALEEQAFTAILQNEIAWFDQQQNNSSALTGQLSSDATSIRAAITDRVCLLIQYSASICLAITLGFKIKWQMAVVTIATFPFSMIGGSMKQGFMQKGFAGDLEKLHAQASSLAGEAVTNIRTLASFNGEDRLLASFKGQLHEPLRQSFRRAQTGGILFGLSQCALHLANATGLWYVSVLVKHGDAKYSDALKVFQILAWTGYVLAEALSLFPDMRKAIASLSAIQRIINRKAEINPDNSTTERTDLIRGELKFIDVEFSYPSRPLVKVLSQFNLQVEAGKTTALVGASGSGKSSVTHLILRFYEPASGSILLDDKSITSYNLRSMRQHMSLVQQEPALFSTTIRSNIAYGKQNTSEDEIIAAARVANAHEFISSLPAGYETEVGERGVQLSGGQKQRIAIARAVIRNPSILILDEATSALDSESERVVQHALDEIVAKNKCTTLVVAHRLTTVQNADAIAVLGQGSILEIGSHEYLIANKDGAYAQMVQPNFKP